MRHGIKRRKLNRTSEQRQSLLKGLSKSLLVSGRLNTTLPKAKELRPYVEKIITLGKKGKLSDKRIAFSILQDVDLVNKLFNEITKKFENRNGGYTRILKYGFRTGDSSPMAIIELVEDN